MKYIYNEETERLVAEVSAGVHSAFTSLFGLQPEAQAHIIKKILEVGPNVTGVIVLTQDKPEGSFLLSFPPATIFAILSAMYQREFKSVDASVRDGVGELTNIIYGVVKSNLNKNGYKLKMALPHVLMDEKDALSSGLTSESLVIPFKTKVGEFSAVLAFETKAPIKTA